MTQEGVDMNRFEYKRVEEAVVEQYLRSGWEPFAVITLNKVGYDEVFVCLKRLIVKPHLSSRGMYEDTPYGEPPL